MNMKLSSHTEILLTISTDKGFIQHAEPGNLTVTIKLFRVFTSSKEKIASQIKKCTTTTAEDATDDASSTTCSKEVRR